MSKELIELLQNRAAFFRNPDYVRSGFPGYLIEPLAVELEQAADALEAALMLVDYKEKQIMKERKRRIKAERRIKKLEAENKHECLHGRYR